MWLAYNNVISIIFQGCYEKGKEWVKENFYTLGAAGIALGILQVMKIFNR
jgi:hypothetical protein